MGINENGKLELANAVTHGLGTALAITALTLMVIQASLHGTARHIVSASLFGAALVLLYMMSTLYHSFRSESVKRVFRILDHWAIFMLIAGTYTPFCLVSLKGAWGWSLFGVIWGLAALGITFKSVFGPRLPALSTTIYIAMGWIVVIAIFPLWRTLPRPGIYWLFGGGLCYTGGVVFYAWKQLRFHHAIWHLWVLAGSACHVVAVIGWVIPR
jgi:hemolysin III